MNQNKTAVIISIYKNDTLEIAKEMFVSLFEQTTDDFDILVQEDGPVDTTLNHYLEALETEKKIVYLGKRAQNRGLAYSLNQLITVALHRGYTLIFRMDSDDIAVPERIELQQEYLLQHPETDIVGGWIEEFNTDTGKRQIIAYPQKHNYIKKFLQIRSPMAHVTVAFRSTFFDKTGLYNPGSLCEDLELWIRALDKGCRFHNLPKILVRVRTDHAFYARRKNIKRAYEVMVLKIKSTKMFHFGIRGYLYAIGHFLLFMAPSGIKKQLYKLLR